LEALLCGMFNPPDVSARALESFKYHRNSQDSFMIITKSYAWCAQGRVVTLLPDAIVREQPHLREVQVTPPLPGRTVAFAQLVRGV
jgi:hypothetical protein